MGVERKVWLDRKRVLRVGACEGEIKTPCQHCWSIDKPARPPATRARLPQPLLGGDGAREGGRIAGLGRER